MARLPNKIHNQATDHAERTSPRVSSDFKGDRLRGHFAMPRETLEVMLEMLAPDEPLLPPVLPPPGRAPFRLRRETAQKAWQRAREKRARFPGYQPSYRCFPLPPADAPTHDWMTAFVRDMKGCWCEEVRKGQTNEQFVDWVPTYLTKDKYVRRWQCVGHLVEAAEAIGRMYGIPLNAMRRAGK